MTTRRFMEGSGFRVQQDRRRIETRPNGFPAPAESPPSGSLRTRLRLAESTPLVLNVGRITFKKGLDLLLEAAAQIPDAQFAIMGPDDGDGTLARLRTRRQELGLADRVHFVETSGARGPGGVYGEGDRSE